MSFTGGFTVYYAGNGLIMKGIPCRGSEGTCKNHTAFTTGHAIHNACIAFYIVVFSNLIHKYTRLINSFLFDLCLAGGGYCWCFHGCNPNFTDNNSMGSCCQDYPQQCLGVKMPVCLDARSQGSALNLFLAHMKISSL